MPRIKMFACVLFGSLLVSSVLCAPAAEKKQKVTKRDIGSMSRGGENMAVDDYRTEILPGMVDDQVAEAFLKDAAREDERQERREEQEEEEDEEGREEEDEGPVEVPLALPMARVVDEDGVLEYAQEKPAPHSSKALSEDIYPSDDEGYLPYYPTGDVYFRRRRRARPVAPRIVRKRSPYATVRDAIRPSRLRTARRKRQIRLSDSDLNALISFLTNLKVTMERASGECNNPAHHSFFREKELNEELGAGSGIDEDYSDDEQQPSPEQEYPVWLMPHAHQMEPLIAGPQRRSFYYPTMLPGQKRSAARYASPQRRLENKLMGIRRAADANTPPRRFFQ